jgi:thiamine-monophosphate kinase
VIAGRVLVDAGIRVGGDISDGLYREVERLLDGTRLGATLDLARLPLARGLPRKDWALAVKDSEDFELVCAAPAARVAAARRVLARIKVPLTVVGEIDTRPGIRLQNGSRMERLEGAGYEHFR